MIEELQEMVLELFDLGKSLGMKGLVLEKEFKKVITFKDVFVMLVDQIEIIKNAKNDMQ